jgi:trk system potassium uptake protein TrkA
VYVVVNGGGKVGSALALTLLEHGHEVAIIEKREEVARRLAVELPDEALIIIGDGCDVQYQEDAGVAHADVFAAVTGEDDDNLVACQLAKVAFAVPRTVARVNAPRNEKIFLALDIEAISSTTIIARMIEEEATVGDIRTLIAMRKGNMAIVEVELPVDRCVVCNTQVKELELPVDCILIALIRGDDIVTVHGETEFEPGDVVIAFTRIEHEAKLKKALTGE